MNAFEFVNAQSIEIRVRHSRARDGKYLAGGIDLLGEMKEYIVSPPRVVNVKSIPGLNAMAIRRSAPRGRECHDRQARQKSRLCKKAGRLLRRPPRRWARRRFAPWPRSVANLAQHSRCWYYRQRDLRLPEARWQYVLRPRRSEQILKASSRAIPASARSSRIWPSHWLRSTRRLRFCAKARTRRSPLSELYQDAWNNPLAQNSLQPRGFRLQVFLFRPPRARVCICR